MKMILMFIETAFAYILTTFELQFEAINYIPPGHPAKKKLVYQMQQIVSGATKFIEEVEMVLIEKVEARNEELLATSAQFREEVQEASQHIPDLLILQQLKQLATAGHKDLVIDLQKAEDEVESELRDRIKRSSKRCRGSSIVSTACDHHHPPQPTRRDNPPSWPLTQAGCFL